MKITMLCVLLLAVVCAGMPGIAFCASSDSGPEAVPGKIVSGVKTTVEKILEPTPDSSAQIGLDNKMGYGTSGDMTAQGPVAYDDNTGMMNVVPSDSFGRIED